MFGHLLGWYTISTFLGLLLPDGILPGAKFTLHPSLAFSYIGSVTALQRRGQPKFAAWYKECSYGTFAEGTTYIQLGGHHHILVKVNISVVPVIVTVCSFTFLDLTVAVASLDF